MCAVFCTKPIFQAPMSSSRNRCEGRMLSFQTPPLPFDYRISTRFASNSGACSISRCRNYYAHQPKRPVLRKTATVSLMPASDTADEVLLEAEKPVIPAIVLVDHGSRVAAANDMLFEIASAVHLRSKGVPVFPAHMELAEPTIADAVDAAIAKGATHILVVPFFLARGRHVTSDIPALVSAAAGRHAGITYDIREPIGTHPGIADVVIEKAGALVK